MKILCFLSKTTTMKKTFTIVTLMCMATCSYCQSGYKMNGPYEIIARDGAYQYTKRGSERDMKAALDCAKNGNKEEALYIINAYANTLKKIEGHDAPLCAIQCYDLVRAMTLLRENRQSSWDAMVHRAMIPMMNQFEADSPYANGNWGAIVNRLRMACGIYLQDSTLYRASVDYYLHGKDNGALPYYIDETGQCQETGRDQAHVQLGLEALAQTCEMAWGEGDDLWGALDNRLMKGFEYTAKYNLGYDVPFKTWEDRTGLYSNWKKPGEMNRGKLWDIYELPYMHYTGLKGLSMPYTERIVRGERPNIKECGELHRAYTYPAPEGAPLKHDYEVYVRARGEESWSRIDTYMAKVNATARDEEMRHKITEISYAFFDFRGDVFVRIVSKTKKIKDAKIRPNYRGVIANIQNDSTVQFMLFQPENLSIEINGEMDNNLLLFTSAPPADVAEAKKEAKRLRRKFMYFAPGMYSQDTIRVASNTIVYLAGGSYFKGTFAIEDAHDVSIIGRGTARPDNGYEGCHVHRSENVLIDGLIVNTCPIGGSRRVTVRDVRSISHPSWGDGLNVFASEDITFERVFCRNSDDCTTAYATRKGFQGNTRNIHMKNAVLWADVAHPIFVGIHGNSERRDTIENLTYENIDILYQDEPQVDYQGCMAINCGDNNLVRNVLFENIRVEEIARGCLFQVKVGYNKKYCTAPGRGIEGVTFKNVRYNGKQPYMSVINGYDTERTVENIAFEGLKINGKTIYDEMADKPGWYATTDYVPAYIGDNVKNITFKR